MFLSEFLATALIKNARYEEAMSQAISLIKTAKKVEKFPVHLISSSSRPITNQLHQAITFSAMSSNENNSTCASLVLVIFLLLSQMNKSVTGKSALLLESEEGKLPIFPYTDTDSYTHLIVER